ncbi:hypothetical protein HMPREF9695_00434 [Afipia broomeae ATCC 49717]|uniref:Uncharacterized protein n=1 Tax=Afipia broomeae ATCC 49717 TaxID=883078 RepID=K8PFD6_9BRAD|nr:hypothetical protein HMPREF9695_00434 [Afipia broomeae ATCC 49717]
MKQFPPKGNEPSPIILVLAATVPLIAFAIWFLYG